MLKNFAPSIDQSRAGDLRRASSFGSACCVNLHQISKGKKGCVKMTLLCVIYVYVTGLL